MRPCGAHFTLSFSAFSRNQIEPPHVSTRPCALVLRVEALGDTVTLREEGERLDETAAGSSVGSGLGLGVTGIEGLCCSV